MKESDLAQYFIDYFDDGYEIFKEVPAGGIIDIVARHGHITLAVEVKLSLNFEVIGQAFENKRYCNYSYIAIPFTKHKHFGFEICRMHGIGVLMTDPHYHVVEVVKPKLIRHSKETRQWLTSKLQPWTKDSIAGSQHDRVTAFGNTVNLITAYVRRHPECSIEECIKSIDHHYKSYSGAKSSIYKYIHDGIIKNVRLEGNKLVLNGTT
jgi:hypothetical protein